MADKRKSVFKHSYWHRRSRRSTPDLFTPYLPGPELIPPSPMSVVQTMPVYSISRSCNNLSSAYPFVTGNFSFVDSVAPFDLGLAPSSSVLYTLILVSLKIFQLGQQHPLFFHHEWIGVDPQGPVLHIQLLFLLVPQFPLVEIPFLVFRDSTKISGFQIIH